MTKRFHCPFQPFKQRDGEIAPTCGAHHDYCKRTDCLDYPRTAKPEQLQEQPEQCVIEQG